MSESARASLESSGVLSGVNVTVLLSPPNGRPCVPSSTRDLCQKAGERRSIRWGFYLPARPLRPKWCYNEHFAHGWARVFNENTPDNNVIWPRSSGVAALAETAQKQVRLQQHTPILQVSYMIRYVFSIQWYKDLAETYITCYIYSEYNQS